jgi:hypothetical protein
LRYVAYAIPTLVTGAAAKWWLQFPAWAVVVVVLVASVSYWVLILRDDRWARSLLAETVHRLTGH